MKMFLLTIVLVSVLTAAEKCPELNGNYKCTSAKVDPERHFFLMEIQQLELAGEMGFMAVIKDENQDKFSFYTDNKQYTDKITQDELTYEVSTKSFCENNTVYHGIVRKVTDKSGTTVELIKLSLSFKPVVDRSIVYTIDYSEVKRGLPKSATEVVDCKEI